MKSIKSAALVIGISVVLSSVVFAGGGSDTSGEGFHCYGFFILPDNKFAQVMVNDDKAEEVEKKFMEFMDKYENNEGGTLDVAVGNVRACAVAECPAPKKKVEMKREPAEAKITALAAHEKVAVIETAVAICKVGSSQVKEVLSLK